MITEDLPVSVYFMTDPEDLEYEIIEDFPGNYDEEDPNSKCFFNTSLEVCRAHFMNACLKMEPFLKDRHFSSLTVGIDILGVYSSIASYYFSLSSSLEEKYHFMASRGLLYTYLKNYWEPDFELSSYDRYIWEHEIIHMLDHENIVNEKFSFESGLKEYWIKLLLSYRNEGVADLLFTLKGFNPIDSMAVALRKFQDDIRAFHEINWAAKGYLNSWEQQLQNVSHIYSVGPWMILHTFSLSDDKYLKDLAESSVSFLGKGVALDDQTAFELIRYALKLDNDQFISCLTIPGENGNAFLDSSLVNKLNQLLEINQPEKNNI